MTNTTAVLILIVELNIISQNLTNAVVGKFVYKLNIIYRIDLCRNINILFPCDPKLVDLLDI